MALMAPSSSRTFLSGLNTNTLPLEFPPQRIPTNSTLLPPVVRNTSEPLSPPWTITAPLGACTSAWQSCVILEPETLTLTQLPETVPWVQPVVRPTLLIVSPMAKFGVASYCDVTEKEPVTVRLPLFGPDVAAITPREEPTSGL